ncbi:MAG: TonB-dependent receptor [Candidatus Symbiothrix sp.]|jgi:TonB-linked SusC/RagA family outer membrane protein|nr:TonB-dependent receptor [Candidatus Symbiothrix sp.]
MTKLFNFIRKSTHYSQKICGILLLLVFSFPVFAQQGNLKIEGRVIDEKTSEAIPGATVILKNEKTGTSTEADGTFALRVRSLPTTISVKYLGYKIAEVDIYEYDQPLAISLLEDINALSEAVVIGYGTQKRKELTGAVSSVSPIVLSQQSISFDKVLGGAVAGLTVTQSSGAPGATSTIRIRGSNSISGGNEPLYVVDGYVLYNDNSITRTGIGGTTSGVGGAGATSGTVDGGLNPLTSINSADIESIDVLKDISATAIYGSRGANGVIIITTKKGKRTGKSVNYQGSYGVSQISKKLDLLDANQWSSLYTELHNGADPYGSSQPYNVNKLVPRGQSSDWQDAVLQTGSSQNHQISVSGGAEDYHYLLSGSYNDQQGIVSNTGLTRAIGRVNLDKDVFKNLNVGTNLTVGRTIQRGLTNQGGESSTFDYALRISPLVPIYDSTTDDGYNYYNPFDVSDLHIGEKAVNPRSDLLKSTVETRNISVLGNAYAKYTILPQLVAKVNAGLNLNHATQNFYAPATSAKGLLVNGYAAVGNKDYLSNLLEFTLNYKERFAEIHSLEVLAGFTTEHTEIEYVTAGASGFNNEALTYHSLQSASTRDTPTSGGVVSNLNSVLGRVNYSLLERYNFTATLRADGSSRFPKGHHWGYFPSVGVSWNIDNEPFFNLSPVSALKVRASAGQVGNQEIGDYLYSRLYTPRNYSFGSQIVIGYTATNFGNSDLKWETTTQYNVGLDAGLWNERLNLTVDAYYKKTTDLLVNLPVERTSGQRNKTVNIGDLSNKGLEFSLNAKIIDRKDLQWSLLANIATNRNRIEKLGTGSFVASGSSASSILVQEGEALGTFYGYLFDGVVQPGQEASTPRPTWQSAVQAGDSKFVNKGGDPNVIDEDDRTVLGSVQPKFTYGFASRATYKGIDLSLSFQGSQGNHLYNALRHKLETPSLSLNGAAVLADRWTPTHTNTNVPRAAATTYVTLDSRYIEDASYLRLKDLTIGYTLPKRIIPKTIIRFFASAQNLLTITGYKGYDPEASRNGSDETNGLLQGIDLGAYPTAKSLLFGLSLSF